MKSSKIWSKIWPFGRIRELQNRVSELQSRNLKLFSAAKELEDKIEKDKSKVDQAVRIMEIGEQMIKEARNGVADGVIGRCLKVVEDVNEVRIACLVEPSLVKWSISQWPISHSSRINEETVVLTTFRVGLSKEMYPEIVAKRISEMLMKEWMGKSLLLRQADFRGKIGATGIGI